MLCIYTSQLIAVPKNRVKISEKNALHSKQEKIVTYNSPSELIKAHNFWIGCECGDTFKENRPNDDLYRTVQKLFSVQFYTDEATIASIPNGIDFVFFTTMAGISEHVLSLWYEKIKPGGMLIGTGSDQAFKDQIDAIFQDQNALITQVNSRVWYIQKKHFLSCIIPTYNRAHTLSAAIDSLYKQDLNIPFEVIVTDDASTDNTQEILSSYQKKYANFHFHVHEVNCGASKARNTCIEHAQGDLIFNLDSDNYLEPKSLQRLIELLDTSGCDIAVFGIIKYFYQLANGRKVFSHTWQFKFPHNICSFQTIFGTSRIPSGSGNYLFTKKSFERAKGYSGRTVETWRFGYKQLATGAKMAILPGVHYWHRLSPDGKWNSNEALDKNGAAAFKTYQQYPELIVWGKNFSTTHAMNFFANIEKGIIKPIAKDALAHLFNAYKYEELGLFNDALQEYDYAIQKGVQHENVHAKRMLATQKTA